MLEDLLVDWTVRVFRTELVDSTAIVVRTELVVRPTELVDRTDLPTLSVLNVGISVGAQRRYLQ